VGGGGGQRANLADGSLDDALAPFTVGDDVFTAVVGEGATALAPEGTLGTGKNCLTLHVSDSFSEVTRLMVQHILLLPKGNSCQVLSTRRLHLSRGFAAATIDDRRAAATLPRNGTAATSPAGRRTV
jgi:hypothetical protein